MQARSLAILLATVVAFGAFIWFFERDLPSSDERMARSQSFRSPFTGTIRPGRQMRSVRPMLIFSCHPRLFSEPRWPR